MRISDWSSDVCSSDLEELESQSRSLQESQSRLEVQQTELEQTNAQLEEQTQALEQQRDDLSRAQSSLQAQKRELEQASRYKSEFLANMSHERSEEHTSEIQSLMRISYAVFCLKKKNIEKSITKISEVEKLNK